MGSNISPDKGKLFLESAASLLVFGVALMTANPIAVAICLGVVLKVMWEVWQEDKKEIVCL